MRRTLTEPLLPTRRAAELLGGLSVRTLERWRVEGRGPRYVRIGGRVMYDPRDLAEFAARGARVSTRGAASEPAAEAG